MVKYVCVELEGLARCRFCFVGRLGDVYIVYNIIGVESSGELLIVVDF